MRERLFRGALHRLTTVQASPRAPLPRALRATHGPCGLAPNTAMGVPPLASPPFGLPKVQRQPSRRVFRPGGPGREGLQGRERTLLRACGGPSKTLREGLK